MSTYFNYEWKALATSVFEDSFTYKPMKILLCKPFTDSVDLRT